MNFKNILLLCILTAPVLAGAQDRAQRSRLDYDFETAARICRTALEDTTLTADESTAWQDELMLCENGAHMAAYCAQPVCVSKYFFSRKEFYLFYPMQDKSWRALPNQLDTLAAHDFIRATYVPDGATSLIYSATDADGIRNLYQTRQLDSLWSAPQLINEQITSSGNEIYPVLSADGKTLYFASDGLYGMGGYDLYSSTWDEAAGDWGAPVNLGFPFSSPYDDFLYMNTDDGRYSIFASNRECSRDSVCLYVLEYDSMPLRKQISTPSELKALCVLTPAEDPSRLDNSSAVEQDMPENAGVKRYVDQVRLVKAIRDSMYVNIESTEMLLGLQSRLAEATRQLQDIEIEFLSSGVVIDPSKFEDETQKEVVGASSGYTFTRNKQGGTLNLNIEVPEPVFDYTFKILPEGQFAEDNTLPEGLVYQIQIFASSRKASVAQLKGLSPVFERPSNGKYVYSVGVFRTYADVLSHLNSVKKAGFRTAMITAYRDGKPVSVNSARETESKLRTLFTVKISPEDGKALSEAELALIHQMTAHDIMRLNENGGVIFSVGPFDNKKEADELAVALRAAAGSNIIVEALASEE